jgi:hypothetical protein
MKKLFSKLYILLFLALTVCFIVIIWNVTFGHVIEEYRHRQRNLEIAELKDQEKTAREKSTFEQAILGGEERVKHYLGYRVLEQRWLKGHFHHIDFDFIPDKKNYCVECHGDLPHSKIKELRAFSNMHASFISCQTCHVKPEGEAKTGVFKWYERESGEIVDSPISDTVRPGTYSSKIIPFERIDGKLQRIDTPERIAFAREFRETEKTLTEIQKSKANKIIHKFISKKPYLCEDCHQKEAPLLPFADLGYPQHKIDSFVSTEVIGMIKKYSQFYLPDILDLGRESPALQE